MWMELLVYDSVGKTNKRSLIEKFWDYVVEKMATAVISKLETENKTVIGALNYLNGKTTKYDNADYRGYDNVISALNANKNFFTKQNSYVFTANIKGGNPHLIILGKDESGYGSGLYISYGDGVITTFAISPKEIIAKKVY